MPSGLIALLDDVATLSKLAAASMDDIGAAATKASAKAAGVVIDDAAVTPRYVTGLSPKRELPIIWKITKGSLRNKLLIILPIALLLSAFAPWAIPILLIVGGSYLAFEATEKILEALVGDHHAEEELLETDTPEELEARQVSGAIRTDFILSAEIMVIALSTLEGMGFWMQAGALVAVAIGITVAVYGVVALIVKLDDIGLHLAEKPNGAARAFGNGLVHVVPKIMKALSVIGTAAMLWVGGGIILHAFAEMGVHGPEHLAKDIAHVAAAPFGSAAPIVDWIVFALLASVAGAIVGGIIVAVMHYWPGRKHHPKAESAA
jgi:predicted DNA repair protein MutK